VFTGAAGLVAEGVALKTLISIDPGKSSGVIVGAYSDTEPFRVTHAFQIEGGVEGFLKHCHTDYIHVNGVTQSRLFLPVTLGVGGISLDGDTKVLAEKFTARGSANAGFSYRTEALEPLRVEGAILALGIKPTWVSPSQQYFMGGDSKAEKLKNRNAWFKKYKDLGYYITGKDVGCKDADDARSALAHCISYLRREKHKPTISLFRKE